MSISGVFSKGKPVGHPAATAILRYIPRPRVPWQPSAFRRANLDEADLARLWARGRYRDGPGNFNSGYSTEKTHVLEDHSVDIIPKHELEKYMPDISIPGSKALVTPVSLMSARNGHRITHDMLHSYDPHIGRLGKAAVIDHDKITVEDPNRAGLNAATLDCRGRIYRWLRRGPFFQEDHYFRRSIQLRRDGPVPVDPHEAPLMRSIIQLAERGQLKEACERYRSVTSVPPVEVYRALMSACVPQAQLADAIAIFEDGNAKLFYVARDGEVLYHLMHCAIQARHRARVMWVFNIMCGRFYENVLVRAEITTRWRFRIARLALEFLLDAQAGEEAKAIYRYLADEQLLDADLAIRLGHSMEAALKAGETLPCLKFPQSRGFSSVLETQDGEVVVSSKADTAVYEGLALQRNARRMLPSVAAAVYQDYLERLQIDHPASALWSEAAAVQPPPVPAEGSSESREEAEERSLCWLEGFYSDIAVLAVIRHARYRLERVDLLLDNEKRATYVQRVVGWLGLLSPRCESREEEPMPYLRKSRPSLTNEKVRVAYQSGPQTRLLASEEGYGFYYSSDMRAVEETFAQSGTRDSIRSMYLAQRPVHHEVSVVTDMLKAGEEQQLLPESIRLPHAVPLGNQLHASVVQSLQVGGATTTTTTAASDESLHRTSSVAGPTRSQPVTPAF